MKRPWMPLYIADYLKDTTHLGALLSGAYLHLIMDYWQNGKLPQDEKQLARIARLTPHEWRTHRGTLNALFQEGWKHKRIDSELAHAVDVSNKRSAVAAARQAQLREQTECKESAIAPANADTLHTSQRKEDTAGAVVSISKVYAFESGVIKLVQKDFDGWATAFEFLSLRAELLSLAEWAAQQPKWFFAVQAALAKKNREAKIRSQQPAKPAFKWASGIEGVY